MRRVRWVLFGGEGGGSDTAAAGLLLLRTFGGPSLALVHGPGKISPSERFLADVAELGFPLPGVIGRASAPSELVRGFLSPSLDLLTRPGGMLHRRQHLGRGIHPAGGGPGW